MLSLLIALAAAAPAAAAEGPPPLDPRVVQWRAFPGTVQFMRFYPDHAMRTGVQGATWLDCRITVAGLLTDCVVVSETPTGQGFGAAALRLSTLYRIQALTRDGQATAGRRVRLAINFRTG